jgi:hypothetical protein
MELDRWIVEKTEEFSLTFYLHVSMLLSGFFSLVPLSNESVERDAQHTYDPESSAHAAEADYLRLFSTNINRR